MRFIKQNESIIAFVPVCQIGRKVIRTVKKKKKKPLYRNDFKCPSEGLGMLHIHLDALDF